MTPIGKKWPILVAVCLILFFFSYNLLSPTSKQKPAPPPGSDTLQTSLDSFLLEYRSFWETSDLNLQITAIRWAEAVHLTATSRDFGSLTSSQQKDFLHVTLKALIARFGVNSHKVTMHNGIRAIAVGTWNSKSGISTELY